MQEYLIVEYENIFLLASTNCVGPENQSVLDFNFKDWLPSWKTNRKQQRIFTSWPGLPTVQHTLVTVQWEYIGENYPFLPGPSGLSQNLWDLCSQRPSSGYGVGRFLRGSHGIHIKAMLLLGLSRQLRNKVLPTSVTRAKEQLVKIRAVSLLECLWQPSVKIVHGWGQNTVSDLYRPVDASCQAQFPNTPLSLPAYHKSYFFRSGSLWQHNYHSDWILRATWPWISMEFPFRETENASCLIWVGRRTSLLWLDYHIFGTYGVIKASNSQF